MFDSENGVGFLCRTRSAPYGISEKFALDSNDLREAGKQTDPEPTEAQRSAGNYRKGRVRWQGYEFVIETPAGGTRRGIGRDGKPWETHMRDSYGYLRLTYSEADKDHLDVFMCQDDLDSELVFVVNQVDPATGKFDEAKIIAGCTSAKRAEEVYLRNYSRGWKGLGSITPMTLGQFDKWVAKGDTAKPVKEASDMIEHEPGAECPGCKAVFEVSEDGYCNSCGLSRPPCPECGGYDVDTSKGPTVECGQCGHTFDDPQHGMRYGKKKE